MPIVLSPQTCAIVKACIPALEQHGLDITTDMYRRLLDDPAIRDLFNSSHQKSGDQPKALAYAVLAYARHIDNPAQLTDMIERIAEKHVGLNILPEHYPFVGKALLDAIAHTLGDQATSEIMQAWKEAYAFLADVLITREQQIYHEHASKIGGWTGWRSFRIAEKHEETPTVTSFTLVPTDGKPVMRHRPGQYLSFRCDLPGIGSERRNYSISSAPSDEFYRITVQHHKNGVVSDWFHSKAKENDVIDVSAPAGDFYLKERSERPLIFISAGSGITPVMSMLEKLAEQTTRPKIHHIHGTQTPKNEIFAKTIHRFAAQNIITADIFYSQVSTLPARTTGMNFHTGRLTAAWLQHHDDTKADYYICGPTEFMINTIRTLHAQGIPIQHIHYEMFGSASDPFLVTQLK